MTKGAILNAFHVPSECFKSDNTPELAVLRVSTSKRGWEKIPRALIEDSRLQFDTRGFANWLIAKPDGWHIRVGALPYLLRQQAGPGERVGRDRVRRFLRELKIAGYLSVSRSRNSAGRWVWRIEFSETQNFLTERSSTIGGSTVDGSATDGAAVDGQGVDLLKTLNNSRLNNLIPTTTVLGGADKEAEVVVGSMIEIRYPGFLQGPLLESARKLLETCPIPERQAVLDEFGAMHSRGRVRCPMGLLKSLIDRAKVGQFVPNCSLPQGRLLPTGCSQQPPERRPPVLGVPAALPMVSLTETGRQALSELREKFKANTSESGSSADLNSRT